MADSSERLDAMFPKLTRAQIKTGVDLEPEDLETARWPLTRRPYQFETSQPRVFAVGDVRSGA